jgi:predicted lipoprotein with Yx(FWY)xxD motif
MTNSAEQGSGPRRLGRVSALGISATGAALAVAAAFAAMALSAGTTLTVGSASNSKLGERVLINAQGRTLYALSPETASHLLCKSSECLSFWPPLTVPSRSTKLKDGAGVHGHLGILRRSNGLLQVTLGGMPLYRFANDHAKGQVNGQGIKSFGGTWHAVKASSTTSSSSPAMPSMPQPTTPAPSTPSAPGPAY